MILKKKNIVLFIASVFAILLMSFGCTLPEDDGDGGGGSTVTSVVFDSAVQTGGTTRSLAISGITVANGETVSVAITSPTGYSLTGSPKTAVVYRALYKGMSYQGGIIAYILQSGAGITYAAGLARAYNGGVYTDWYLPSKDELNKLYLNKVVIGGFAGGFPDGFYWSSSEDSSTTA